MTPTDPRDHFNELIASLGPKAYKAFPPRRPGLTDDDVAAMRAAHNLADDVAPGDEDHEEFATVVDELDIAHLPPFPWWGV